MHDKTEISLGRIDRYVREWVQPAVVACRQPLSVTSWEAADEPVTFDEAMRGEYSPHGIGQAWGKPWGTTWFRVRGEVPSSWDGPGMRAEIQVDLGWMAQQPGFQAEGAAWNTEGSLIKGISPRNHFVPLAPVEGANGIDFFVEGASNPDVPGDVWTRPTRLGDKATAGEDHLYSLRGVDLVLIDEEVEALVADIRALRGLVDVLPKESPRRAEVIVALESMCDCVDPDDVPGTAGRGRSSLAPSLAKPAAASDHEVFAVGHAHIDSAWLWPLRETERKVGRTVGNVLALMEQYPDFKYAFSSAQQYAWIQEKYPSLFERLRERIADGRVVPVGGMWVEPDTNMPGGEALARQFVVAKRYFAREFSVDPQSVWLPDSFGYSGALPQIARLAGMTGLLTQKLTWNDTNVMPHSTFWWQGIDGSRLFTHFPPVATYNSDLSSPEMAKASRDFEDKGLANKSLAPFGYGDGGGGPTREMILQGRRLADLEGSPKVLLTGPDEFFTAAYDQYADHAPTWVGEMYLEYHRGTYTTQHRTKQGNRRSESLLYQAELWATSAAVRAGVPYPYDKLQRIWERVLLMQFHDILPGSSIAWVHRQAEDEYEEIRVELEELISSSLESLVGSVDGVLAANAAPRESAGLPAFGIGTVESSVERTITRDGDGWTLQNDGIRVRVDERGLVVSALDLEVNREVIPDGQAGNLLQLFRDIPNSWEAWDIEHHYKRVHDDLTDVDAVKQTLNAEGVDVLEIERSFSKSSIKQTLWLEPGRGKTLHVLTEVDWHEKQKLLKLAFPLDLITDSSESEMQFGFVERPTHDNTSWDAAKFETVAHRWVRAAEADYGVVLANDCTYGHDIARSWNKRGPGTMMRVSLLRAPLFPDPVADQGAHVFHHTLTLGADVKKAYELGYRLNVPVRTIRDPKGLDAGYTPLLAIDGEIEVSAVKLADDKSGDVIVRVFEPRGARVSAKVHLNFPHRGIGVVGLLEEEGLHPEICDTQALNVSGNEVRVSLKPFQILTLRISR